MPKKKTHFSIYRIRPNYRTVRLGFSKKKKKKKKLGKALVKCVPSYTNVTLKKKSTNDFMCFFFIFVIFFIKAYVVGTHLNCIDLSTHNICLYKEVDIKYTGCNLKNMELLDCALIGVCAVIRSNTVIYTFFIWIY